MHDSVNEYVARWVDELHLRDCHHLDVGSLDVNGSNRVHFTNTLGVDMRDGPGVDYVVLSHSLPFMDGQCSVVTCTEMLEHDTAPWQTVKEIARVLRPGGIAILTARGFDDRGCFPVHDYPGDHWRFSVTGFRQLLEPNFTIIEVVRDPEEPGVFAVVEK